MTALQTLFARVRGLISRAVVEKVDEEKLQAVQVSGIDDELRDGVERFGEFGLASVPPKGSECLLLSVGASRAHLVIVAVEDRRVRPTTLQEGEVALYTDNGVRIYCKTDGEIHLGSSPSDYAALASKVDERIGALEQWAIAHGHKAFDTPSTPALTPGTSCAAAEVKIK
jgi:phage baseplate assembly protein V